MMLFEAGDMTSPQKQTFVRRWERIRRRGMPYLLLRTVAAVWLILLVLDLSHLLWSGPFTAETWANGAAAVDLRLLFYSGLGVGLVWGLLSWYGGEELYRNFSENADRT